MDREKSSFIIRALATGINPVTGEALPAESPYNEPDVIRALFSALEHSSKENLQKDQPKNAGLPWTDELKTELENNFRSGKPFDEIANHFHRTRRAIISQLAKQGLIDNGEWEES